MGGRAPPAECHGARLAARRVGRHRARRQQRPEHLVHGRARPADRDRRRRLPNVCQLQHRALHRAVRPGCGRVPAGPRRVVRRVRAGGAPRAGSVRAPRGGRGIGRRRARRGARPRLRAGDRGQPPVVQGRRRADGGGRDRGLRGRRGAAVRGGRRVAAGPAGVADHGHAEHRAGSRPRALARGGLGSHDGHSDQHRGRGSARIPAVAGGGGGDGGAGRPGGVAPAPVVAPPARRATPLRVGHGHAGGRVGHRLALHRPPDQCSRRHRRIPRGRDPGHRHVPEGRRVPLARPAVHSRAPLRRAVAAGGPQRVRELPLGHGRGYSHDHPPALLRGALGAADASRAELGDPRGVPAGSAGGQRVPRRPPHMDRVPAPALAAADRPRAAARRAVGWVALELRAGCDAARGRSC